jgi:hypothetical protein
MNDIASMRKTGPFEPFGVAVATIAVVAALAGLAAAETVGDFEDFFVEGKKRF